MYHSSFSFPLVYHSSFTRVLTFNNYVTAAVQDSSGLEQITYFLLKQLKTRITPELPQERELLLHRVHIKGRQQEAIAHK